VRRRLDAELVRRGLVDSRGTAVEVIAGGRVIVAGAAATSPSRRVAPGEPIKVQGPPRRYVSRGGDKLEAALAAFPIDPRGARALDAGASTGGFTDCLLQHGAASVVTVDVGRGQLAWSLRSDPRVEVHERTNVRSLEAEHIGGVVALAVADLSFISLLKVAPALARCTAPDAELVVLVKPQFEAGRAAVGKGGIVRDPRVHREVVRCVAVGLSEASLPVVDVIASPLAGADGNREFLAYIRRGGPATDPARLAAAVDSASVT
jgi:23S rRNA (cytidine1920-2'-O)/16S rRNA (cytidine1409-2'-O)-methyltransferase